MLFVTCRTARFVGSKADRPVQQGDLCYLYCNPTKNKPTVMTGRVVRRFQQTTDFFVVRQKRLVDKEDEGLSCGFLSLH